MRSDARALTLPRWRLFVAALLGRNRRLVGRGRGASRLHREREGLRHLSRFPFRRGFERFDCPRLIEMEHGVELVRQTRPEVVALALGVRTVNTADPPLEPAGAQVLCHRVALIPDEQEANALRGMEERLVAAGERRPHAFALGWLAPIGGCRDGAVVRGKPDQHGIVAVLLARELADVQLAALAHFGRARVAEMGIMFPDGDL